MNLSKTNPISLRYIQGGAYSMETMRTQFQEELSRLQRESTIDESQVSNIGSMFFPMDETTKIIKVTNQVQKNANLINFETIQNNVTDLDLPFKNAVLLLNGDDEGMVKVNVLRNSDNQLVLTFLWYSELNDFTPPKFTYNGYRTWRKDFMINFADKDRLEKHKFVIKLMVYLFHGEISYKKLPPKSKTKLGSLSYFKNDTKTNIWFANSLWKQRISVEGFKVRGHFRLQAHGPGRKLRKLKWIESFEKKGYNREATRTSFEKN